jgi:signal transduction histidine kinase
MSGGLAIWLAAALLVLLGLGGLLALRQRQRLQEQRLLLAGAGVLLWQAQVQERQGALVWDLQIPDQEAAQRFLPLRLEKGESYAHAYQRSKLPQDRPRLERALRQALRQRKGEFTQEFRCCGADGQVRWLAETVRLRALGLHHWRLAGVCTDITQRQQAQEMGRLNLALQRLRDQIVQMKSEEDWLKVMEVFHRELSALIEYDGCGINMIDTAHQHFFAIEASQGVPRRGQIIHSLPRALCQALEEGRPVYRRNRSQIEAYGDLLGPERRCVVDVPFLGGTVALNSVREEAFGEREIHILEQFAQVLSVAHRRLEDLQRLAAQEPQVLQAQWLRVVEQLSMGLAHEINNPLTSVIGFASLLLREKLDPTVQPQVEAIHEGGVRAAEIVRRLQAFARMQKSPKQVIDLNQIARDTAALVRYSFAQGNVQVLEELEENLPPVEAHPGQLQQVLLGLLNNSREAIASAGRHGRVRLRTRSMDGWVRLEVEDDGPGIPQDICERIFEPFFTTRPVGQGMGLGLSMALGIVGEHGGRLRMEQPEQGARLVVELPAWDGPA